MKLVFVTAEAFPFVKIGGLGEVMGSLPAYLHLKFRTHKTADIFT